jgi:uncharacterized integral membrane protein
MMHLRTVFLLLLFILCSIFLIVNWEGVMANVTVNLLWTEIQAPLGLILLLGPGLLILICLVYGFVQQAGLSMELRRVNKQLQQARDLAQKAELSRFTELKSEMQKQITELQNQSASRHSSLMAAINGVQAAVDESGQETVNSLSASVGEVEDRLSQLVEMAVGKEIDIREKKAAGVEKDETH